MRKPLIALAAVLIAGLGTFTPAAPAASAASGVKVAIIVGATHGTTPTYRSYADQVYNEAIKYTSSVVRVYSPNATASKVKAAVSGASIIVYLGHGNGWPSPYTYDPNYTTKDGFGLNSDLNGDGKTTDNENKYYGEPWIRDLRPAPNAVVLLFHLCYASGNPESGPESSLSKAKQRVDNYAAAFLKAGARAVVANGHSHDPYYIRALFTTRGTIDEYWRNAPDAHDNVATYASVRNPGYTFQMDPEKAGSYYRSIAGKMSLKTQDVTGAPYSDTSVDPATMVVPGNASPRTDGSPVYGSRETAAAGSEPVTTLASSAKVRVDAVEPVTSVVDGSPVYRVHTDSVEGWMTGGSLVPRDSAAPRVWEVDDGAGTFSPNSDGAQDTFPVSIRLSEPAAWTLQVTDDDGKKVGSKTGTTDTAALTWAPATGSVADGRYHWTLEAVDGWGNGPLEADGKIVVDTAPPAVSVADADGPTPQFTPNGDKTSDTIGFAVGASEPGSVTATVKSAGNTAVDHVTVSVGGSSTRLTWDGRNDGGGYVADGTYKVAFVATDLAGNRSEAQTRPVAVFGALGYVATSKLAFYPQDGDSLARTTSFSYRLRSAATVDWTIQDASGALVRTIRTAQALAAGTHAFTWNGRNDVGAFVPRGTYRSVVTATDGTLSATQRVEVVAAAFKVVVSDTTPGRGQRLTVTATSAEPLDGSPKLRIYQPGISGWTVTMTKIGTRVYRARVTLKKSSTGTLRIRVKAPDRNGVKQATYRYLILH